MKMIAMMFLVLIDSAFFGDMSYVEDDLKGKNRI